MFSSLLDIYLGLECIPVGLYAKSVFNFLRTIQTIFYGSCPVFYAPTSNLHEDSNFHILSGLPSSFFLLLAIPVGVKCISLWL